jgi:hypothetical protein
LTDAQPEDRANERRGGQNAPALKQSHAVPDHPAGEEGQRTGHDGRQFD